MLWVGSIRWPGLYDSVLRPGLYDSVLSCNIGSVIFVTGSMLVGQVFYWWSIALFQLDKNNTINNITGTAAIIL